MIFSNFILKNVSFQEQQKTDLRVRTVEELREYEETVKLLIDMLDSNSHELTFGKVVANVTETPLDLIKELYERCVKYKQILKQMPTITDCSDKVLLGKILCILNLPIII